ncbi:hypothetical protein ACFLWA_04800, partial [Chloroflexota bacterium]
MSSTPRPVRNPILVGLTLALVLASLVSTPALADPADGGGHLLITELVVTPTEGEFIEIYNPGASAVILTNVYLTDATLEPTKYYYNIVTGSNAGSGYSSDFHVRFPSGATIGPGAYQTVALNGS